MCTYYRQTALVSLVTNPGDYENDYKRMRGADGGKSVGLYAVEPEVPARLLISTASSPHMPCYLHDDSWRVSCQSTPGGEDGEAAQKMGPSLPMQNRLEHEFWRDVHSLRAMSLLLVIELESALNDGSFRAFKADEASAQKGIGRIGRPREQEQQGESHEDGEYSLN